MYTQTQIAQFEEFNQTAVARNLRAKRERMNDFVNMIVRWFAIPLLLAAVVLGLVAQAFEYPPILMLVVLLTGSAGFFYGAVVIWNSMIITITYSKRRHAAFEQFLTERNVGSV